MLTDKEIQDTVFAVLRRWKDDRAWDRFTRESGAYDVTSLRAEVMEIIKAVLVADGAIDDASLELGRLLNHIHGDSGQYVAVQGWKKAATDALAKLTTPGVPKLTLNVPEDSPLWDLTAGQAVRLFVIPDGVSVPGSETER